MSDVVKIRVRSGQSEAEVEAAMEHLREAIELIPEVVSKLPESQAPRHHVAQTHDQAAPGPGASTSVSVPAVALEKGDSLSDIITKFFADPWGKSPRKLSEVRGALQSYGLNYPKQSVAVALLRLAKTTRVRRFKSEGGEYVYTASTSMMPSQVLVLPESEEAAEGAEPSADI